MLPLVATKTVSSDHRVEMELPGLEPGALVTVLVVPAAVAGVVVDANAARRKANGWLTDHVGHVVMGTRSARVSSRTENGPGGG